MIIVVDQVLPYGLPGLSRNPKRKGMAREAVEGCVLRPQCRVKGKEKQRTNVISTAIEGSEFSKKDVESKSGEQYVTDGAK